MALLAVAALGAAACSSSGTAVETSLEEVVPATIPTTAAPAQSAAPTTAGAPPSTGAEPPADTAAAPADTTAAPAENLFPDVEVVEVVSGEPRQLKDLGASDRPLLLWFWAPH